MKANFIIKYLNLHKLLLNKKNYKASSFYDIPKKYNILNSFNLKQAVKTSEIEKKTNLIWGEHCVECSAPDCYSACDYFSRNKEGKCRRFLYGIKKSRRYSTLNKYSLEIVFMPWSNLLANVQETLMEYSGFLLQIYNPNFLNIQILFYLKDKTPNIRYLISKELCPGFNQFFFPFFEIENYIKKEEIGSVFIAPDVKENRLLFISFSDFIKKKSNLFNFSNVKCIVFDLDNTLWNGILVEDGPEKISINNKMLQYIKEFKQKGIIVSIVSKNNWGDVKKVLEDKGISELFVFPKVNWERKSTNLKKVSDDLGIGMDSIVLVDDSAYERAEVEMNAAGIRVLDSQDLLLSYNSKIIQNIVMTQEGKERNAFYKSEETRKEFEKQGTVSKEDFIRFCKIFVKIGEPKRVDIERIHELVQRTNRLNFSNHRYTRDEIEYFLNEKSKYICKVVSARDKFGDYGIIGFYIIEKINHKEWLIKDMMFSCRIQGRQIDLFVIQKIIEEALANKIKTLKGYFSYNTKNENAKHAFIANNFIITTGNAFEDYFVFELEKQELPHIDYISLEK